MNLIYTAIVLDDPSAVKEMFPCEYPDKCKLRKDVYGKIITKGLYRPAGPFYVTL